MAAPNPYIYWALRLGIFSLIGGVGIFMIMGYLDVLQWPVSPRRCRAVFCDPHHWSILAMGIAAVCAAFAILIPDRLQKLKKFNATILTLAFIAGLLGTFAARP